MADGTIPLPNAHGDGAVPPQKSDSAPVQVVVVQQNPSDDDRDTVRKLIDELLGSEKPDSSNENPQARKLTVALSSHNLLIVIALLILAGGELAGVGIRLYKDNQDQKNVETLISQMTPATSQVQATATAAQQTASSAQSTAADAKQAASNAESAAVSAERAAVAAEHAEIPRTDLALQSALIAAALRNASTPSQGPVYIEVPTPISATPAPSSSVTGGTGSFKIPVLPKISIVPCSSNFKTVDKSQPTSDPCAPLKPNLQPWAKVKFPGPIQLWVKYQNNETKMDLAILDIQAFLTTANVDPGIFGDLGICPAPKTNGWQSLLPQSGRYMFGPANVSIDQLWNRAEPDKAKQEWTKGVYLTVCTTFRSADSMPILNRAVFPIIPGANDGSEELVIPADDVQNFILQ